MTSYAQARHWAKTIIEDSEVAPYRKATLAAARYILDHPPATMKDVDWDDKHHLMEAENHGRRHRCHACTLPKRSLHRRIRGRGVLEL